MCPQLEQQRLGERIQLEQQRLDGKVQLENQRLNGCPLAYVFLILLLLLDCRLLLLELSPHEVEGGGETTTGEGETVF